MNGALPLNTNPITPAIIKAKISPSLPATAFPMSIRINVITAISIKVFKVFTLFTPFSFLILIYYIISLSGSKITYYFIYVKV